MTDKAKAFMAEVEKHGDLKKRLELIQTDIEKSSDEYADPKRALKARYITIAEEYGYALTEDDLD